MSTLKPRITITLQPHAYEVLRRLSSAGGESMSSLVTQFLDVAIPPMERMVVVMEQANSMSSETKEAVRGSLLRAEAKLLPALTAAIDQNDLFLADVVQALEPQPSGALAHVRRAVSGSAPPVPVTRGVGRSERSTKGKKNGVL
jgi:hypothetical protein